MRLQVLFPIVLGFLVSAGHLSAAEMGQESPESVPESVTEDSQQESPPVPESSSLEKGIPRVGNLRVIDFYAWMFGDEDEEKAEDDEADGAKSPSFFGAPGSLRSFDFVGWLFGDDGEDTGIAADGENLSPEDTVAALSDDKSIQSSPPPVTPPDYEILFTPLRSPLMAEGRGERFDLYLWFLTELPARRVNTQLRKLTEKQQR